jgi:hypothetical protein
MSRGRERSSRIRCCVQLNDRFNASIGRGLIETVTTEVGREINQGKRLAEVQDSVPKAVAVDELKQQFAGNDQENRDFFDETFAGLVKAAFDEMIMR